ncbi:MAG: hypothetical protein ABSF95_13665 [Verrucomicrobiota bacterium]|jgi:hypothetical protein
MKTTSPQLIGSQTCARLGKLSVAAALGLGCLHGNLQAQSDNFDSGTLSGWSVVFYPPAPTPTVTFPAVGAGKGLRVQASAGGLAFFTKGPQYTDFYVSVDMAAWDDTLNQALVLLGRGQNIETILGTTGYVCNYDPNQHGADPSSRLGGELQINRVDGLQAINTIAAAEVKLEPGRPYRLVFQAAGTAFTAQLYDYFDLTAPLVTIQAEDVSYDSGSCGLVSYSRSTTPTDATFDNYLATDTDPNADIAPAIRHPVPGTPQVVTRVPVSRFTNFYPPASGISFTANTFSTSLIAAAATKLYLNGVDQSAALAPLPANGTNLSFSTAPGTLQPNTVYAARLELQDVSGTMKSTNTFWFDTLSDTFVSTEPVKTVEAEDYNSAGQFQVDPIPVSGLDTNSSPVNGFPSGYFLATGSEGIDYHDNRTSPEGNWNEYRPTDDVSTIQGGYQEIQDMVNYPPGIPPAQRPNDHQRQQYAVVGVPEYEVVHTEPGEWLNYTRAFAPTNYNVYLRVASYSPTQAELDAVSGDPTTSDQTASSLGLFDIPNNLMRINYAYVPLTSNGVPVVLSLGGTNTLRLTIDGTPSKDSQVMALNYLLFVPAASGTLALMSSPSPAGPYLPDNTAVIDPVAKTVTVPPAGNARFYRLRSSPPALNISSIRAVGGKIVIKYQ